MIADWNTSSQQSDKLNFMSSELGSVKTIIYEIKTKSEKKPKKIDEKPMTVTDNRKKRQKLMMETESG